MKLTKKIVRELLHYDPDTGFLFWKERTVKWFKDSSRFSAAAHMRMWNGRFAGKRAFTSKNGNGYYHGKIEGKLYDAHRVIWIYMKGIKSLPPEIDHDNGNRTDNRWENLKASNDISNARNRRKSMANTSGITGVYRTKTGKWIALMNIEGRQRSLGTFSSKRRAAIARRSKEIERNYHPMHGRR